MAEMYVQGVSTRKVKAIRGELCGHAFSASAISAINKRLDESLKAFACRPLPKDAGDLIFALNVLFFLASPARIVT